MNWTMKARFHYTGPSRPIRSEDKQVVAWIVDQPDWAYAKRALGISACLPQYEHRIVVYSQVGLAPIAGADLIVCPDPRLFRYFAASSRVVLNLNAVKIFAGSS